MRQRTPSWLRSAREQWLHRGQQRPPFAEVPGPGQESCWDYPRPPVLVQDFRTVEISWRGRRVAESKTTWRLLETSHAPTFYLPLEAVDRHRLIPSQRTSFCEWKGSAVYFHLEVEGGRLDDVAWSYLDPLPEASSLAGHLAFYAQQLNCLVDGQRARPQAGGFYGGWITPEVVGPFKGDAGTAGW